MVDIHKKINREMGNVIFFFCAFLTERTAAVIIDGATRIPIDDELYNLTVNSMIPEPSPQSPVHPLSAMAIPNVPYHDHSLDNISGLGLRGHSFSVWVGSCKYF